MTPIRKDFEYFLSVCEYLNFSHAAEFNGIQQAAISKSIKKLEEELCEQLFIRHGRGIKITEFGLLLQKQLVKQEALWNREFFELLEEYDSISGKISIGIHETVAINSLGKVLPKLNEINKNLNVEFKLMSSRDVVKNVISGDLDFGFAINPIKHPDLVIKTLKKEFISTWSRSSTPEETIYYNPEMIEINKILRSFQYR